MYIRILLLSLCCSAFYMQTMSQDIIRLVLIADDYSLPVDIVHTGDNRLFVVEKHGIVQIVDTTGQKAGSPFLDIRSRVSNDANEQGLLGMCFHPDYFNNGYFFLNYTRKSDGSTVIARYSVDSTDENKGDFNSEKVLLVVSQPFTNHNAGDLEFGPDGYLYIGFGDGGSGNDPQNRAQNPMEMLGKMLRIDVDNGDPYAIPPDNPYANDDFTLDEIWALGLRNPWRYSFDRETGDLYIADVGQSDWEEVNVQKSMSPGGQNYGWRCFQGNAGHISTDCADESTFTFPAYAYPHEGFSCSGSITGGYMYRGSMNPNLYGKYIFTDYCTGKFRSWTPEDSIVQIILEGEEQSFTTFGEDAVGELYAAAQTGEIYKIEQTSTSTKTIPLSDNLKIYPVPSNSRIFFTSQSFSSDENVEVSALNILGINILNKFIDPTIGLDVSSLSPGVYCLRVSAKGAQYVGKFIVK